ncbi:hypothetical protein ABBQ38_012843 [Trebouxia sp. C0009 RCD-2024]
MPTPFASVFLTPPPFTPVGFTCLCFSACKTCHKHRASKQTGVKGGGVRKTVAKGVAVKRRVGKGGEAGRSAGTAAPHVPGSTNCNAKEEANAFLAGMGLHAAVEERAPVGSRGSQAPEILDGAATAPANTDADMGRMSGSTCSRELRRNRVGAGQSRLTSSHRPMRTHLQPHLQPPQASPFDPYLSNGRQWFCTHGYTRGCSPTAALLLHAAPPVQAAVPFFRPMRKPPSPASTAHYAVVVGGPSGTLKTVALFALGKECYPSQGPKGTPTTTTVSGSGPTLWWL